MKYSRDLEKDSNTFAKGLEAYMCHNQLKYSGLCNFASMSFCEWRPGGECVLFYFLHVAVFVEDLVVDFTAKQFDIKETSVLILPKQEYLYWLLGCLSRKGINFPMKKWKAIDGSCILKNKDQSLWSAEQRFTKNKYKQLLKHIENAKN